MREQAAPHQGHRSSSDSLMLLRCDEPTDNDKFVDEMSAETWTVNGAGDLLVAGGLFSSPTGTTGARSLDGSVSQTRASSADERAALLLGTLYVGLWCRPTGVSGSQRFLSHGGSVGSESSSDNCILQVGLNATEVDVFWEFGPGANIVRTTSGAGLEAGGTYLVQTTRRPPASGAAGACDLVVQIWEPGQDEPVHREEWADVALPTNGFGGAWWVGSEAGGGNRYAGLLDDVHVAAFAASDEYMRDAYARAVRDYDVSTVHASGVNTVRARVLAEDGSGDFVDLTDLEGYDFVESVEWGRDVDDQVETATVNLFRNAYDFSLGQLMTGSKLNVDAGGKLLQFMRQLKIEYALLPHGSVPAAYDWQLGHHGFQVRPGNAKAKNALESHDLFRALQNTWVKPDRSSTPPVDFGYGSDAGEPVEQELQAIIDDQEPSVGYKGGRPTLYTPTSPSWNLHPWWTPSTKSVAQELEERAAQIGWLVQSKWDDDRQEFRLTLHEPERTKTWSSGAPEFEPGTVLDYQRLEEDGDSVRNVVEVEYGDALTEDPTSTIARDSVLEEDIDSQDEYGELYCRIGIESTSQIQDSTKATVLALAALADLSTPKVSGEVEVVFSPHVEIGDVVRFHADGVHFDVDTDFAVIGFRHRIGRDGARTTLTVRYGKPAGRVWRWFDLFQSLGVVPGKGLSPPKDPSGLTVTALVGGLRADWDFPTNHLNGAYLETEVHVGDTSGFTPSSSTLREIIRGKSGHSLALASGATKYLKIVHRDRMRNRSSASSAASGSPRYTQPMPRAKAYRSLDLAYTSSAAAKVTFNSEAHDVGGAFSTVNSRWTAPVALDVALDFAVGFTATKAHVTTLSLRVNGSTVWTDTRSHTGTTSWARGSAVVSLAAGDYVEVWFAADDSGTIEGGTNTSYCTVSPISQH